MTSRYLDCDDFVPYEYYKHINVMQLRRSVREHVEWWRCGDQVTSLWRANDIAPSQPNRPTTNDWWSRPILQFNGLFLQHSVDFANNENVLVVKRRRRPGVALVVPQAPAGDAHRLFLLLTHLNDNYVFVPTEWTSMTIYMGNVAVIFSDFHSYAMLNARWRNCRGGFISSAGCMYCVVSITWDSWVA